MLFLEVVRESAWDNIVTCHQGDKEARTWSFQRKCIGKHHLKSHAGDKAGPVMVCKCGIKRQLFRVYPNTILFGISAYLPLSQSFSLSSFTF